jgi:hypothetical protein
VLEADVGSAMLCGDGETQRQMRFADQVAERLSATCPLGDFLLTAASMGGRRIFRRRSYYNLSAHDPGGSRTRDLRIKSPLLYQLSYRVGVRSNFASSNHLDNSRGERRAALSRQIVPELCP